MAGPKTYVGVSSKARQVKNIYVGVSSVARKVKKVYAGVGGKARLVYAADWFTNSGSIATSNVLGAYNFKNATSATTALNDLSGHGNTLTNSSAVWSSSGYQCSAYKYLDNSTVRSNSKTIIMKITSGDSGGGALPLGSCGGLGLWLSTPFCTQSFWYEVSGTLGVTHENGLSVEYSGGGTLPMNYVRIASAFYGGHVLGFTYSGEALYANGSAISLSVASYSNQYGSHGNWTGYICSQVPRLVGGYNDGSGSGWASLSNVTFAGSFIVQYLAVYSIALTAAQQSQIATILNSM